MDELRSLFEAFGILTDKPSKRYRWINWIVWGIAIACIGLSLASFALLASHWLTGWPPN
jgi:hypothetical protein